MACFTLVQIRVKPQSFILKVNLVTGSVALRLTEQGYTASVKVNGRVSVGGAMAALTYSSFSIICNFSAIIFPALTFNGVAWWLT